MSRLCFHDDVSRVHHRVFARALRLVSVTTTTMRAAQAGHRAPTDHPLCLDRQDGFVHHLVDARDPPEALEDADADEALGAVMVVETGVTTVAPHLDQGLRSVVVRGHTHHVLRPGLLREGEVAIRTGGATHRIGVVA
jgi:hypothetical protein